MSSGLVAPLVCTCGAAIGLVRETWDTADRVYVGQLVCSSGHAWIDIRNPRELRPHGQAFAEPARRLEGRGDELERAGYALAGLVQLGFDLFESELPPAPAAGQAAARDEPPSSRPFPRFWGSL